MPDPRVIDTLRRVEHSGGRAFPGPFQRAPFGSGMNALLDPSRLRLSSCALAALFIASSTGCNFGPRAPVASSDDSNSTSSADSTTTPRLPTQEELDAAQQREEQRVLRPVLPSASVSVLSPTLEGLRVNEAAAQALGRIGAAAVEPLSGAA